ncbi:MAG: DUF4962 domain-containing protein [Gammaproteobacteria bacterium]|nr:DUF4962 domain-containing protein [Gammaproteobacteria bacterium]
MPSGATQQSASTLLDEPRAGRLTIGYSPIEGDDIVENPPRFTWLPVLEDGAHYALRIQSNNSDQQWSFDKLPLNFFTPDVALPAGNYSWAYAVCDAITGELITNWSSERTFHLSERLPITPLSSRQERYKEVSRAHPRLWMTNDRLDTFRSEVTDDPTRYTWSEFFDKSVSPWMDKDVLPEPMGYPNHQRVAHIWRQTYIDCQELLYAIRHLAIGGKVTNDRALIDRAKQWLLAASDWDPNGTTSRAYTDEWAFRVNLALAWGYDWLYDELTDDERNRVKQALLARTRQTADHLICNAKIQLFPYDSHAVRAVSAVLIPACIALLDETPEAEDWLNYSVEFLFTVYSPWGDHEGGWAEGPHYWMTGMAYLIDAANLLKSYTNINLYHRPFFQQTGDFPLYTKAPNTRRATFGDDSTMGDLPAVKIGFNLRQFAGVTGKGEYRWYYDEICKTNPNTENAFYNWGWWDFRFDELTYQTDFPDVPATAPSDGMRCFNGIGWVGIQKSMADSDNHLQFVMKSSPYGSISHSHGDQNAFCLAAYGEDLAIQSGYYVAFNSTMHQNWRRQTRSKNAILINGNGQYAGKDKAQAMRSTGSIATAEDRGDHIYLQGDATAAYQSLTPEVNSVLRDVYFVNDEYFVIVDSIDASRAVSIDWLLHTNSPMTLGDTTFRYTGERAGFYGQFLWSEAGAPKIEQFTEFTDVDPVDYEGLPISTHLKASFPTAIRHRIATLLVPYSLSEPRRIYSFLDDQGYDCDLYFTDADDRTFKIVVPKTFDVGSAPAVKNTNEENQ